MQTQNNLAYKSKELNARMWESGKYDRYLHIRVLMFYTDSRRYKYMDMQICTNILVYNG